MAEVFGCPPSQLYGLPPGSIEAAYFDRAVGTYGLGFRAAIEQAQSSSKDPDIAKQQVAMVQMKWLNANTLR